MRHAVDWNWERVIRGSAPNLGDVALFAVFNPGKSPHAWRHRNEEAARPVPVLADWVTRAVDGA